MELIKRYTRVMLEGNKNKVDIMNEKYVYIVTVVDALPYFEIVREDYWRKHKVIEDDELGDLNGLLDYRWDETQESTYLFWDHDLNEVISDPNEGRFYLNLAGLTEVKGSG